MQRIMLVILYDSWSESEAYYTEKLDICDALRDFYKLFPRAEHEGEVHVFPRCIGTLDNVRRVPIT